VIGVSGSFRERQEFAGTLLPRIDGIIGVRLDLDPPDVLIPRMSPFADRGLTEFRPVCSGGGRQSRGGDVNEPLRDRRQIARIGEKIDQTKNTSYATAGRDRRAPAAVEVLHGEHAGRLFGWRFAGVRFV